MSYSFKVLAFPKTTLPRPHEGCDVASNIRPLRRHSMNKLLATLVAGAFAAVSTVAAAQTAAPAPAPAPEKSAAEKAKENVKAAQSTDKAKAFADKEKAAQDASRNSPNPNEQKANVE